MTIADLENAVDPAETLLCMRILRARQAIDERGGRGLVDEAMKLAWHAVRERANEIRDARDLFWHDDVVREIASLTGSSHAVCEFAVRAILLPTRHAVAINALEAFALENGISLRNGTA